MARCQAILGGGWRLRQCSKTAKADSKFSVAEFVHEMLITGSFTNDIGD